MACRQSSVTNPAVSFHCVLPVAQMALAAQTQLCAPAQLSWAPHCAVQCLLGRLSELMLQLTTIANRR